MSEQSRQPDAPPDPSLGMTASDAGKKGGGSTLARHGREHFVRMNERRREAQRRRREVEEQAKGGRNG